MEKRNRKNAINFLIVDFQQQYEEYRQAENSRMRCIEYFVTIIAAFLSFSAYLLYITGFPTSSRSLAFVVSAVFAVISMFLFVVGFFLFRASLFSRISQNLTAIYIDKLREYFSSKCEKPLINYAKIASFVYDEWSNERIPAIRLLLLFAFLTCVPLGVSGYYMTRLIMIWLFPMEPWGETLFRALIYPEHVVGFILGLSCVVVSFLCLRRYLKKTLEDKRKDSVDRLRKLENAKIAPA